MLSSIYSKIISHSLKKIEYEKPLVFRIEFFFLSIVTLLHKKGNYQHFHFKLNISYFRANKNSLENSY